MSRCVKCGRTLTPDDPLAQTCGHCQRIAKLEAALPSTFFADREVTFRVQRMVETWRNALLANAELESRLAEVEKTKAEGQLAALLGVESRDKRIAELEAQNIRLKDAVAEILWSKAENELRDLIVQ